MRTGYAAVMPAPAVRTYRGPAIPGPSHDTEDAILKARLARANTEPFTAHHMAAYAAYAGISDRTTALKLHRGSVTWDDVDAYSATGLIKPTSYTLMIELASLALTPAKVKAWQQVLLPRRGNGVLAEIRLYAATDLTRTEVATYMADPIGQNMKARDVIELLGAGVRIDDYHQWRSVDVQNIDAIAVLHQHGCTPALANHLLTDPTIGHYRDGTQLALHCLRLTRTCTPDPHLLRAGLLTHASGEDVRAWHLTGLDPQRAALFMSAGYATSDWTDNPQVRTADNDSLAMLAGLRGNRPALAA